MTRFVFIITIAGLSLAGCGRLDDKIVGNWKSGKNGTMSFSADGTWRTVKHSSTNIYWFTGTWKIKNDILTMTVTNSSDTNWPFFGESQEYHIRNLTGHQLEFEHSSPIIKYTR